MSMEEDYIKEFQDKPRFVIYATIDKHWVVEVFDIDDALRGRLVFRNKSELMEGFDTSIPDDDMDVNYNPN